MFSSLSFPPLLLTVTDFEALSEKEHKRAELKITIILLPQLPQHLSTNTSLQMSLQLGLSIGAPNPVISVSLCHLRGVTDIQCRKNCPWEFSCSAPVHVSGLCIKQSLSFLFRFFLSCQTRHLPI